VPFFPTTFLDEESIATIIYRQPVMGILRRMIVRSCGSKERVGEPRGQSTGNCAKSARCWGCQLPRA